MIAIECVYRAIGEIGLIFKIYMRLHIGLEILNQHLKGIEGYFFENPMPKSFPGRLRGARARPRPAVLLSVDGEEGGAGLEAGEGVGVGRGGGDLREPVEGREEPKGGGEPTGGGNERRLKNGGVDKSLAMTLELKIKRTSPELVGSPVSGEGGGTGCHSNSPFLKDPAAYLSELAPWAKLDRTDRVLREAFQIDRMNIHHVHIIRDNN